MGLNESPKTGLYEHCSYKLELYYILYYICTEIIYDDTENTIYKLQRKLGIIFLKTLHR